MTISLSRRIGKVAYGYARGRARRHWFDVWPGLGFERDTAGRWTTVTYRGTKAAALIPCRVVAERVVDSLVVVGSGPSLRSQCTDRLRERDVVLCNGSLDLIGREQIAPLAVFIEDEGFVLHHPELVVAIPEGTHCFFTPPVLRAICEIDPGHLGKWQISLAEILHRPIQSRRPSQADMASRPHVISSADGSVLFSTDCDGGFGSCGTVAYCALQFAVQCAPNRIGLAGIDLAHFDRPRINEHLSTRSPSHLQRRLPSILEGMALAATICRERGIATENYSSFSLISGEDFPYDDWLDCQSVS